MTAFVIGTLLSIAGGLSLWLLGVFDKRRGRH